MASSTATSPLSPTTPTSPINPTVFNKEAPLADYYTIAIMANSPVDNNDMMTSFSNPNYTLMDADAINSNLPAQYYSDDNNHVYEDVQSPMLPTNHANHDSNSQNTPKSRKKYANMDLSSMGIGLASENDEHNEQLPLMNENGSLINTPDSVTSIDSEDHDSAFSGGILSPDEKTSEIVQVEHTEDDTEDEAPYAEWKPKGFLGYYASLERSAKTKKSPDRQEKRKNEKNEMKSNSSSEKDSKEENYDDKTKIINSPDSNDSGIQADHADVQHIHGPLNDDIYAVVQKPSKQNAQKSEENHEDEEETTDSEEVLPNGWEKHEDDDGAYYWHIKSGTIQRDPPPPNPPERQLSAVSDSSVNSSDTESDRTLQRSFSADSELPVAATSQNGSDQHLQEFEGHAFKYATESLKSLAKHKEEKDRERRSKTKDTELPIRFAVRSLGWVRVAEEDLTPEKSSKAVNKCIVDLSLGRNDINDVVGRWGDGKDLDMDLDEQSLILIDPQDMSVLNVQPIQSIRVWGVGRDNGRDFAYVARDRITRKHMCHVFRCDTPARQIANTLRDICQKIMLERSRSFVSTESSNGSSANGSAGRALGITRPTNLPFCQLPEGQKVTFESLFNNTSFPTPMEEPKKVIRCHYLGTAQVPRPTGVEGLNSAAEKVYSRVPPEKWVFVSVAVAPSTITITEHGKPDNILSECRVRFLSFMGIAQKNVKLCSFIMHTAQDQFVAHVFHCEPSAGALCKTIEAACKLRYQKCLDSHHNQMAETKKQATQQHSKPLTPTGITSQLKAGAQNLFEIVRKKASNIKL